MSMLILGCSFQAVSEEKQIQILEFLLDEVEICNTREECQDIAKDLLPDPNKTTIVIEKFDQDEGYLMFKQNGEEKWVHQTEVELNSKSVASIICTTQNPSNKSDQQTFATLGLGEGC